MLTIHWPITEDKDGYVCAQSPAAAEPLRVSRHAHKRRVHFRQAQCCCKHPPKRTRQAQRGGYEKVIIAKSKKRV